MPAAAMSKAAGDQPAGDSVSDSSVSLSAGTNDISSSPSSNGRSVQAMVL